MAAFTAFAVYFIIWWITLFLVLPYGVRSQAESGSIVPGTDPGAPVNSHLVPKLVVNTLLAALVFALWYWVTRYLGFELSDLPSIFPPDR